MKKRFFLVAVFLVLFSTIVIKKEDQGKDFNNYKIRFETISAKGLLSEKDDAIKDTIPDFVLPFTFILLICTCISAICIEFNIGTVERKPKYRKQMPRGNLA